MKHYIYLQYMLKTCVHEIYIYYIYVAGYMLCFNYEKKI